MNIRPLSLEAYQRLLQVSLGKEPASVWFKHVRYLNVHTGQVERGHIVLSDQRIAYVGEKEPLTSKDTEIVELDAYQIMVPGYIEPHGHPFHWYNPWTWGEFLLTQGTTMSINDNVFFFANLDVEKAIQFINELDQNSQHLSLWWARFDAQTDIHEKEEGQNYRFTEEAMQKWLAHPLVMQGGEFTAWPQLLQGDEELAKFMLMTRQQFGKRIEGHLPGASLETLNALAAAGIGADHESLNGKDVLKRLRVGMYTALRYSSIRPDLPQILRDLREVPNLNLSRMMLTNDGSIPFFVEESGFNQMVKIVLDAGFSEVDAYRMATLNPATYYGLDQDIGSIAPGRLAHMNILEDLSQPTPVHVMVDGKWAIRNQRRVSRRDVPKEWLQGYFRMKQPTFTLDVQDLNIEQGEMGIQLVNAAITRPYAYQVNELLEEGEVYLSLVNQQGKWVLNTRMKGFSLKLTALASSYTATKDYVLIGKDREQMLRAFDELVALGGGIVAYFDNGESMQISLPLAGGMSAEPMEKVIEICTLFVQKMKDSGYAFEDPVYTLLFLTATHLPFIRLTSQGVYLIKEQQMITPVYKLRNNSNKNIF